MQIKISGNDVMHGSTKVGWIEVHRVYDENGRKVGWFDEPYIYDADGKKIAYVQGNRLERYDGGPGLPLDDIREEVKGGTLSDLGRAAVRLLLISH